MMIVTGARAGRGRRIAAGGIAAAVLLLPAILLAQVDTAWVRRYDGPAHLSDLAKCIAVDGSGNVVVAGDSRGTDSTWDWITIKYSPTGDSIWAIRRNSGGNDFVRDLSLDAAGNAYVTGLRDGRAVTERYGPDGQVLWSTSYGSRDSVDLVGLQGIPDRGAVLCGGRLTASWDALLVRYRSGGETAWVRTFDIDGSHNAAAGLAVNDAGEVYAVGSFLDNSAQREYCVTFKSDSLGDELWTRLLLDSADTDDEWLEQVVLDRDGNVVAAGASFGPSSGRDYLTIKYSPDGETLWTRRYNGPADDRDEARAVAVDSAGNVYVTGTSYVTTSTPNAATLKYAPDGSLLWLALFGGPAGNYARGNAIALDNSGNVYICGIGAFVPGAYGDFAVIKYDAAGDTVWVGRYNGPANGIDEAVAIAVDRTGSVYVTGRSNGPGASPDIVTIKYIQPGAVAERQTGDVQPVGVVATPNPFTNSVGLQFWLSASCPTAVRVHDIAGRAVRTLTRGMLAAGQQAVAWDGTDDSGAAVGAGVYLISVDCGARTQRVRVLRCR